MKIRRNVGIVDRILRYLIAAAVIISFTMGYITGLLGIILLAIAIILLLTSISGVCLMYSMLGIHTNSTDL